MKKKIARYIGLRVLDAADWLMRQKPEGEQYTAADKEFIKRIRKLRADFK